MRIIAKCAKFYGVTPAEVMGTRRFAEVVAARHSAWAILRYQGVACTALARKFNRDHTSIIYGSRMGESYPLNKIMEFPL